MKIFCCRTWRTLWEFRTATLDLAGITWTPDSSAIVVRDTQLRFHIAAHSPTGEELASVKASLGLPASRALGTHSTHS